MSQWGGRKTRSCESSVFDSQWTRFVITGRAGGRSWFPTFIKSPAIKLYCPLHWATYNKGVFGRWPRSMRRLGSLRSRKQPEVWSWTGGENRTNCCSCEIFFSSFSLPLTSWYLRIFGTLTRWEFSILQGRCQLLMSPSARQLRWTPCSAVKTLCYCLLLPQATWLDASVAGSHHFTITWISLLNH